MTDPMTMISGIWAADESSYQIGNKFTKPKSGTLMITEIRFARGGYEIWVLRQEDGWAGMCSWVPATCVVTVCYQLPSIQKKTDDSS